MMKHKRASGGKVADEAKDYDESKGGEPKAYDAQGSNVEKEASERKRGGKVRKRGGKVEGEKPKMRMDRACRKDGGRVGSDKSPFTSARNASKVVDHQTDD